MEVKNQWKAWIYLAPALVLMAIFTFYPFFKTILLSFMGSWNAEGTELGGYNPTYDFGWGFTLKNYLYSVEEAVIDWNTMQVTGTKIAWHGALVETGFLSALKNTAVIAVVTVPGSTIIALLMAVALNSIKPLQKFLQTIYFLPYVTNSIAIGLVFAMLFEVNSPQGTIESASNLGLINKFLGFFGINPRMWVHQGASWGAKMTVACVYGIWNALPFKIMILLGALQSVNKQYYDAAKVDCASRARTFWKITVPMLSPMISYVIITGFIGAFKEYSSLIGLFGDNLEDFGMNTIVGIIYTQFQEVVNYGKASAYAMILFVIILLFTLVNLYVSNKKVHY